MGYKDPAKRKAYYEKNKEKEQARHKAYLARVAADPEKEAHRKAVKAAYNKKKWDALKEDSEQKEAYYKRTKAWRAANPEKTRTFRKPAPGEAALDWAEKSWEGLYEEQDGRCRGCDRPLLPGKGTCVDHCHLLGCGKVRHLLCPGCNLALGNAKDSPRTLRQLADLAEAHAKLECAIVLLSQ